MALPLLLLLLAVQPAPAQAPERQEDAARELVVLVHGLGRTRFSMLPLERALEDAGYRVLNWGYPSTAPIAALGAALADEVDRAVAAAPGTTVHFVGHSLGNILVRWMLANDPPPGVGRVVMLAPPNQGARVADRFAPWLGWLLDPLPELSTEEGSTVRSLPPPTGVEFAIVSGTRDGKVSPEETLLPGAADHALVPSGHTFIMMRPDVHRLVLSFLRTGAFEGGPPPHGAGAVRHAPPADTAPGGR